MKLKPKPKDHRCDGYYGPYGAVISDDAKCVEVWLEEEGPYCVNRDEFEFNEIFVRLKDLPNYKKHLRLV